MAAVAAGLVLPALAVWGMKIPVPETAFVSQVVFSPVEQAIITVAAFVLKPLYQVISLLIVILLWKRTDPDLAALRRAMVAFLIGENACALNYLIFHERSLLMEFLHSYGMALCFGLVVYAVLEAFDRRILHYSDLEKKCALLPLCGRCYKYSGAACNLRLLFLLIIPATAVVAAIPLTAPVGSHFFSGRYLRQSGPFRATCRVSGAGSPFLSPGFSHSLRSLLRSSHVLARKPV